MTKIKIEAAKRIASQFTANSKGSKLPTKITVTAASTDSLNYGSDYKKAWKRGKNDSATLKTVEHGALVVRIMPEADVEKKHGDKEGNLLNGVPSIEIKAGGKTIELTWNEAFNLADMLIDVAGIAYFG